MNWCSLLRTGSCHVALAKFSAMTGSAWIWPITNAEAVDGAGKSLAEGGIVNLHWHDPVCA